MDEARARELLARVERELAECTEPEDVDERSKLDQHPAESSVDLFEQELEQSLADDGQAEYERSFEERGHPTWAAAPPAYSPGLTTTGTGERTTMDVDLLVLRVVAGA